MIRGGVQAGAYAGRVWTNIHVQLGLREPGLRPEDIDAAVEAALPEDEGLDWKMQLPFAGSPKGEALEAKSLELAKDVAAMANGVGGVIVFGVQEARTGVPMAVVDVAGEEEVHEQQMRRVISSRTYPPVGGTQFAWIRWEDGSTVLALHVPASPDAPHLVRPPRNQQDQGWFQAPWRNGSHTQFMSERQIENAYRVREQRRREHAASARERFENFVVAVGAHDESNWPAEDLDPLLQGDVPPLWVVLAAVPVLPRPDQLDFDEETTRNAADTLQVAMPAQASDHFSHRSAATARPAGIGALGAVSYEQPRRGLRLFHWTYRPTRGSNQGTRVEFHRDGGVVLGVSRCGVFEGAQEDPTTGYVSSADVEHIVWELAWILTHAVEQGELRGEILVRLGTSRPAQGIRANYHFENRYQPLREDDRVPGLRAVEGVVVTDQGRTELVASLWSVLDDFLSQRATGPRMSPDDVVQGFPDGW